jgi:transcriptional regulator with XRE-family HTH domain
MRPAIFRAMDYREKLRNRLKEMGWPQRVLAEKVGVSQGTISNWLRGKHAPPPESLRPLAVALDMTLDYLLDERRTYPPPARAIELQRLVERVGEDQIWAIVVDRLKEIAEIADAPTPYALPQPGTSRNPPVDLPALPRPGPRNRKGDGN